MMSRKFLLETTVLVGVAAMSVAAPAIAQTQPSPPAPAPAAPAAEEPVAVQELIVTGSRLRRTDFTTAAPVDIITTDESRLKGLVDPAAILQGSTIAAGSVQLNNQFGGFVVNGGNGVNTISLRGLGDQRTLVLLNGRRLNPAGSSGTVAAVDLNVIPSAMVDRYEILKDGASSIYGSDAIGGVVNIITKDNLDGITIEANGAFPTSGAGTTGDFSITAGRVRDKWHVMLGLEYYEQRAIKTRDLPGGACPSELQRAPGQTGFSYTRIRYDGSPYCAFTQTDYIDDFSNGGTYIFDPHGPPDYPFVPFTQDPFPSIPRRTNIPTDLRDADVDALSPVKRLAATAIGAVDLPGKVEFYYEGLLTNRRSEQNAYLPQFFPSSPSDFQAVVYNPFNPFKTDYGPPYGIYPDYVQPVLTTPVAKFTQNVTAGRALGGLRGDLNLGDFLKGWRWDVSFTYGRSSADYTTQPRIKSKVYNALDVVQAPAGFNPALVRHNPVDGLDYTCAINITKPNEGCYPLSFFVGSAEFATDPALAYITVNEKGHTNYEQEIVSGSIDGPLFNLPAGTINTVFGMEYRHDKLKDNPGPYSVARDYFGQSTVGITEGADDTMEVYTEAEAPLIKGVRGIELLTLNVSGRYTHIKTSGDGTTYKVGLNWEVLPSFRARATYGTSYRGPALFENFLASQSGFQGLNDPCSHYGRNTQPTDPLYKNCASEGVGPDDQGFGATPEIFTAGALGRLKPETSKNLTAGIVWQPAFFDFKLAIDYFQIEIDNEIDTLGANFILNACYTSQAFRSGSPYCAFVAPRNPSNEGIEYVHDDYINIARQVTRGVDVTARYQHKFTFGKLQLDGQMTYTDMDKRQILTGQDVDYFNGTFGDPRVVWNAQTQFTHGDWTLLWNVQYVGATSMYKYLGEDPAGRYDLAQETTIYHDLSLTYEASTWKATLGVRNLFNELAPTISNNPYTNSFVPRIAEVGLGYGTYDLYGRTVFFNVSKTF